MTLDFENGRMSRTKITQEQFDWAYELHQENLKCEYEGEPMSFLWSDLTGIEFPRNAKLSGCDLRGSRMKQVGLNGACFLAANLWSTEFLFSALRNVNFIDANLEGANFSYSLLDGSHFSSAKLTGVKWAGTGYFALESSCHTLLMCFRGTLEIGNEKHPIEVWEGNYQEIMKRLGYPEEVIKEHRIHISYLAKMHEYFKQPLIE